MTDLVLSLRTTPARRHFKSKAGQNNHFLITVLVGLDGVLDEKIDISPDFSTSWTPKDRVSSYHRSRQYVLESALVWITELVDGYRSAAMRLDGLLPASEITRIDTLKNAGGAGKLHEFAKVLGMKQTESELIIRAAYSWRNQVVHSTNASGRLSAELRARLVERADQIRAKYRGLEIEQYISNVEGTSVPTFKETASTIAAAQEIVELIDASVAKRVDLEAYAESLIANHMRKRFENGHRSVFVEYWPRDAAKTTARLRQLLLQSGLSPTSGDERSLSSEWVSEIVGLSARDARARYAIEERQ